MAAVTGSGYGYPPPVRSGGRNRWLAAGVAAWVAVLTGGVFWSVRNDPPTVPEQRDLGQVLRGVRTAAGAVVAAAEDDRWVLRLGGLRVEDCAITPVRDGQEATRDVMLYVPEGEARAALEEVAGRLPAAYGAGVVATRGATRLSLFADAGDYVGVEATAHATDQVLTLRIFTGCRPAVADIGQAGQAAEPTVGPVPGTLATVISELNKSANSEDSRQPGASGGPGPSSGPAGNGALATPESWAVACPGGGTATTFVADGGPADPESAPRGVPDGTTPVWSEPGAWAYRIGPQSVVITTEGDRFRVSLTTGCRAG